MTKEESHVTQLRAAYKAWSESKGASVDTWMTMFADDISFSSIGEGKGRPAYFGAKSGKHRMKEYYDGMNRDWLLVQSVVSEFMSQGDVVVVRGFCACTYRNTGKTLITPKMDFWRFRDGKVVELFETFDTAAMLEAMR